MPPSSVNGDAEKVTKTPTAGVSTSGEGACSTEANGTPVAKPVLRSVPRPVKPKVEPSSIETIDLDADWTSAAPLTPIERSSKMKEIMARIPSPPNELDPDIVEMSDEPAVTTAPDAGEVRPPPSQKLELDKLSDQWQACAKPVQSVGRKYLTADGVFGRTDVEICDAMEKLQDDNNALWCRTAFQRFVQTHRGKYRVPPNIRCDRTFLQHPHDALYVDKVSAYLFNDGQSSVPPILDDANLYGVFVPGSRTKAIENRMCWAVGAVKKRVLTYEDFFIIRRPTVELSKATVQESGEDKTILLAWDALPVMPAWLHTKVDLRSVSMPQIRALVYFAKKARSHGLNVYQRWQKLLQFEVAMHVTVAHYASWAFPILEQSKVWVPPKEHIDWLKGFESLPPIPAYFECAGKYVNVTVSQVVKVLEDAVALGKPQSRVDFCTRTTVRFFVTPNAHIYADNPLCEASPAIDAASGTANQAASASAVPSAHVAENQPTTSAPVISEGVIRGRIVKIRFLRKDTRVPEALITSLGGNGPWTVAEVLNHIVANERKTNAFNSVLNTTVSELRSEMSRLRGDVDRYRGDATRYQTECQQLRSELQRRQQPTSSPPTRAERRFDDYGDRNRGYDNRSGPNNGPRGYNDDPRQYGGPNQDPYARNQSFGRRY